MIEQEGKHQGIQQNNECSMCIIIYQRRYQGKDLSLILPKNQERRRMAQSALSKNANSTTHSGGMKIAFGTIVLLTIGATISLFFAITQTDVRFSGDGAWANERGCVSEARVYTLALFTLVLSLITACYGFLRECISDLTNRKMLDRAFSIGASSSGSLFVACCILFLNFRRLEQAGGQRFAEGDVAKLVFGLCCLILWMIFFGLIVRNNNNNNKKKNSKSSVDNSPLI